MRRFCVFKRNNHRFYYAQIKNPDTGKYLPARSTGTTDKSEAYMIATEWLQNGLPGKRDSANKQPIHKIFELDTLMHALDSTELTAQDALRITSILQKKGLIGNVSTKITEKKELLLIPFIEEFWDYDKSSYVREKLAYGQSIGKRHCYEQTKRIQHWKRFFSPSTLITDIAQNNLRNFQLELKEYGLAPKTINTILNVGTVAFGWLKDRGDISTNPAAGLRKFSGTSKKRDILSQEEAKRLFSIPWDDERSRVGNLLAMTTGLRAGEVVALQAEDIKDDTLLVRHSWSFADGLKSPKNGEERVVPLLPQIRKELLNLLESNPYGSQGFIFYGVHPDKPMNIDALSRGLTKAYIDISISSDKQDDTKERENTRKDMIKRGICFHSWRHFYTANLADRIEMRTVQLATGHKTSSLAEHYANHKQASHLDLVSKAVADFYEQINLDTTVVPAS